MKIGRSLEISNGGWESALLHQIGGEEKNVGLYFGFCGDSDNDLESISLSLHLHQGVRGNTIFLGQKLKFSYLDATIIESSLGLTGP